MLFDVGKVPTDNTFEPNLFSPGPLKKNMTRKHGMYYARMNVHVQLHTKFANGSVVRNNGFLSVITGSNIDPVLCVQSSVNLTAAC